MFRVTRQSSKQGKYETRGASIACKISLFKVANYGGINALMNDTNFI